MPDPHLGVLPPPDPPNQLNNPQPPIVPRTGLGGGGGNPQLPPANAFPQFAGQQQEVRLLIVHSVFVIMIISQNLFMYYLLYDS